ncbi:unnamed protein product [Meloidogyne enterolobii]|uniref:Uncharacterized protein n=1 Tax=Meloidogyne enterolobii TaxID=390850 RepID=A0ACB0YL89_MELEN
MSKTPTEKSFEDDGYECYNPVCSAFRQEMTEKYSSLKSVVDGLTKKISDLESDKSVAGDLQKKIDTLNKRLTDSINNQNTSISSCNNICSNVINKIDGVNQLKRDIDEKIGEWAKVVAKNTPTPPSSIYKHCENKLDKISDTQNCCDQNCKNSNGLCNNGNGVVRIRPGGNFAIYRSSTQIDKNRLITVLAKNKNMSANIPSDMQDSVYVTFYFEVTIMIDEDAGNDCDVQVGLLKDENTYYRIGKDGKYHTTDRNNNSIFSDPIVGNFVVGVGQTFAPRNMPSAKMQLFFTKGGTKLRKIFLVDEEDMLPHILMKGVDVEVNFGDDSSKPFVYDINNHEAAYSK